MARISEKAILHGIKLLSTSDWDVNRTGDRVTRRDINWAKRKFVDSYSGAIREAFTRALGTAGTNDSVSVDAYLAAVESAKDDLVRANSDRSRYLSKAEQQEFAKSWKKLIEFSADYRDVSMTQWRSYKEWP